MGGTPVRSPLLTVTVTGLSRNAKKSQRLMKQTNQLKPGFHSNAIASLRALRKITKTARNASACQRKRLRFLRFSFTQRTQRKRLRLNGNRASLPFATPVLA